MLPSLLKLGLRPGAAANEPSLQRLCSLLPPWTPARQQQQQQQRLASSSSGQQQSALGPDAPPAFVFDIDGVLIRGKQVLPAAVRAMARLADRAGRWKYPVCFLTNGGGLSEAVRAAQLSQWLQLTVSVDQVRGDLVDTP